MSAGSNMDTLFAVDWGGLFIPKLSIAEMILRGTLTYLTLFLVVRFFLKRQTGVIGIADLLVIVLIADAMQNAMAGEYGTITEGVVLLLTIAFWNYALDWIGHHVPWFEQILRAPPLLLIKDGQMLRRNMRQELITEEELMSQMRQQGCDKLSSVERAYIEGDGRISIIRADGGSESHDSGKRTPF